MIVLPLYIYTAELPFFPSSLHSPFIPAARTSFPSPPSLSFLHFPVALELSWRSSPGTKYCIQTSVLSLHAFQLQGRGRPPRKLELIQQERAGERKNEVLHHHRLDSPPGTIASHHTAWHRISIACPPHRSASHAHPFRPIAKCNPLRRTLRIDGN